MPSTARDLATTYVGIQLALSIFMMGIGGSQLIIGPLSHRVSRRPVPIPTALDGDLFHGRGQAGINSPPGRHFMTGGDPLVVRCTPTSIHGARTAPARPSPPGGSARASEHDPVVWNGVMRICWNVTG